jgi:hypothetical protein
MRFFTKPAALFIPLVLVLSGLVWNYLNRLDLDPSGISGWIIEHLELILCLPVAVISSLAISVVLLRSNWKISFVDVALTCVLFNVGICLGIVTAEMTDFSLGWPRLRLDAAFAGLMGGAVRLPFSILR